MKSETTVRMITRIIKEELDTNAIRVVLMCYDGKASFHVDNVVMTKKQNTIEFTGESRVRKIKSSEFEVPLNMNTHSTPNGYSYEYFTTSKNENVAKKKLKEKVVFQIEKFKSQLNNDEKAINSLT